MKILGIGVDVVNNKRIQPLIKNQNFIKRTFGPNELKFSKIKVNRTNFFAKRFAAKEALSKALGVGLYRKGIYPKYISVKHNDFGKPSLSLSSELETIVNNNMKIQLSITDSDTQSIAFVVIES